MASKEEDSSDDEGEKLRQFKVILLGNGAVGKTSIATRFAQNSFAASYKQTIGLDFFLKNITVGGINVALQLWDIGGQTIGGKMIRNYIYGANVVVLCYDVTNADSFADLEDWYRLVKKSFGDEKLPFIVLLGNKIDLNHMRAVKEVKARNYAVENEFLDMNVSAKSGDKVDVVFTQIAAALCGVIMQKAELDSETAIVTAAITNHQQHDEKVQHIDYTKQRSKCSIM